MKLLLVNLPLGSEPKQPKEPATIQRQVWCATDRARDRTGYGRTRKDAVADMQPDFERFVQLGHLHPPGYEKYEILLPEILAL